MLNLEGVRGRHLFVVDLVIVLLSILGSMILRFDTFRLDRSVLLYFPAALLPLLVRPPVNALAGLYSRAWSFASVGELMRIATTVALGTLVTIVAFYLVLVPLGAPGTITAVGRFPRSFFVLEGLLTLTGYGGIRFLIRASSERSQWFRRSGRAGTATGPGPARTLIFGAGNAGASALRTIASSRDGLGMHVVGLIDDDPRKRNQIIRGAKVLGAITDLPEIARVTGAHRLLVAVPSAPGEVVRRAVELATGLGLETRTLPALEDLVSGRLGAAAIREIRVEDLLRRASVHIDEASLRELVGGRTVLVTGAGGSIGSELARQVFDLDPARLVLLDRAEGALYDIDRELAMLSRRDSGSQTRSGRKRAELVTRLADIANRVVMAKVLREDRPVLVLHAAAYKHVPMMEHHPADAVWTNVGGTLSVLDAAIEAGVERFVLVSTDKAVEPSSVMGATKRLAELAVRDAAQRTGRNYVSVRFGNVLGSSGSVVPLFQKQLQEGVPITITDLEATRFFMTIPEASRLILQAALFGHPGDLFVLDMGEPVKVIDLAKDLARLAGRDPESVPIEVIGLRPGEKLHESLFYDAESTAPTPHPKVIKVREGGREHVRTREALDALVRVSERGDHRSARQALRSTLEQLDPAELPVAS